MYSTVQYIPRELKLKFPRFQAFSIYQSLVIEEIDGNFMEVEFDLIEDFSIVGDSFKSGRLSFKPNAFLNLPNLIEFFLKWYRVEQLNENMFNSNRKLKKIETI